jgi:hypothetical protein
MANQRNLTHARHPPIVFGSIILLDATQEKGLASTQQFLGLLRSAMIYKPEQLHMLDKDYRHCDQAELATHLAKHFFAS